MRLSLKTGAPVQFQSNKKMLNIDHKLLRLDQIFCEDILCDI